MMTSSLRPLTPVAIACLAVLAFPAQGQTAAPAAEPAPVAEPTQTVIVNASADASAKGLVAPYAGGQVARGGRIGILGNQDMMDTPFAITSYTNQLIQDQQSKSVGDVLLNDPSVRVARGFGNFQESYFIRGFLLNSDDVAYNGLYSLLPRQYIAAELFERVEVLRGASAFLNGASPGGDAIGGSINLLPKRAPNEPLTSVTLGEASGSQHVVSTDIARRFGPDQSTGLRLAAARRTGGTGIDEENIDTTVFSIGADWRSRDLRLSADIGHQDNKLKRSRTNVSIDGLAAVPAAPDADSNWAQPWSYSNEKDTFGTLRAEYDLSSSITAWAAAGLRRSEEANSLANISVSDPVSGAASAYRFDNTRKDFVATGEAGLRANFKAAGASHAIVMSGSVFRLDKKNAYALSDFIGAGVFNTNLYTPTDAVQPPLVYLGNDLANPQTTGITELTSLAVSDTLGLADDTVLLTVGARHQKFDLRNFAYGSGSEDTGYKISRTSPVVGGVLKMNKAVSVYANYIESLAQGQTAPEPALNLGAQLAPYVSKQKELGVKVDTGHFGGSATVFSTSKPRGIVNDDKIFTSAGKDRHRGVELSVFGMAASGLRILGGFTILDAKQVDTGLAASEGKQVIGVPKQQASLGLDWDVPALPGFSVDARVIETGKFYADSANTLSVPSWTRVDLGARYAFDVAGREVTLRARLDNAFNRDYWASAGGYPEAGYLVLGAPRTFSVSGTVDF